MCATVSQSRAIKAEHKILTDLVGYQAGGKDGGSVVLQASLEGPSSLRSGDKTPSRYSHTSCECAAA